MSKPRMANRVVRVDDATWDAAQAAAAAQETTVSEVIRAALTQYVKKHETRQAQAAMREVMGFQGFGTLPQTRR